MKETGWNDNYKAYNKEFVSMDKVGLFSKKPNFNNRILTRDIQLSLDSKQTKRNNHVFVVSDNDMCTAQNYIIPNILQANSNYVVMDPGGIVYSRTRGFLKAQGYNVQVVNLTDASISACYNPFSNLITEDKVIPAHDESRTVRVEINGKQSKPKLITFHVEEQIIKGDNGEGSIDTMIDTLVKSTNTIFNKDELFVQDTERTLLKAIAHYMNEELPAEERNFDTFVKLFDLINRNEECDTSKLDVLMDNLLEKNRQSKAVKNYKMFKLVGNSTPNFYRVIMSASIRLQMFRTAIMRDITTKNNVDLNILSSEKQALFIVVPTVDTSFDTLAAILLRQFIDRMYFIAEQRYPTYKLPVPLMIVINEDRISLPDFSQKVITSRKYNMDYSIIASSMKILKGRYPTDWDVLIDNCDSWLYLGCKDRDMQEYFRVDGFEELMTEELFRYMPNEICALKIRGIKPFLGGVYQLTTHPRYESLD